MASGAKVIDPLTKIRESSATTFGHLETAVRRKLQDHVSKYTAMQVYNLALVFFSSKTFFKDCRKW